MNLVRSYPVMAFALVLLSIVGFCVSQGSVGLLLIAGALAAMSWYVTEGPRGRSLPKWTANVLIIAASLNVFVDLVQNSDDVMGVLGRFTVWLTLIKLYERKSPRDHAQLLALSLLLMVTGCLTSADLLFGIVLLLYAGLGLYVLVLFQLHAAHEHARTALSAATPAGYRLAPPLRPIAGRSIMMHFRSLVFGIATAGLAFSMAIFVIFPRGLGVGLVGQISAPAGAARSAFVGEINLMSGTRITESMKGVMTVRVLDADGEPQPPDGPVLLRGAVLDRYESPGRWKKSRSLVVDPVEINTAGDVPAWLGKRPADRSSFTTIEISPNAPGHVVFAPLAPTAIETPGEQSFIFDPATLTIAHTGPFRLEDYKVRVEAQPSRDTLESLAYDRALLDQLPREAFRQPRVRNLAQRLLTTAGLSDEAPTRSSARWAWRHDAALAFSDYLQSGEFTYETDLSDVVLTGAPGEERDPIVRFLFDTRKGHCEYFASALAAMCHTMGIQARLITGYVAAEYDESDRQYLVRESNAHAWVEVRTGPYRWVTVDPTPPRIFAETHQSETAMADQLRWIYDRFESGWNKRIITFDNSSQARMADSINRAWGQRLTMMLDTIRDGMSRVNYWFKLGPAGYIWMGIVGFALLIAVIALVKLVRRTRLIRRALQLDHLRGAEYRRLLQQLAFYLDMLDVLTRCGLPKPTWQPPLAYAGVLADQRPAAAGIVHELTGLFYHGRYGSNPLSQTEVQRARALIGELEIALKSRP